MSGMRSGVVVTGGGGALATGAVGGRVASGGGVDMGCGGLGGACFEPEGVEATEAWSYVGPGRGQYQQMSNMQFVRAGGDYNKEQVMTYKGYRCRLWCQILLCLLFLALVGFLIWWFLPRQEREEREIIVAPAPPPPPTCASFNCPAGYVPGGHGNYGNYDCNAGLSNWAAGWSESKKTWCCAHEGKGCPGSDSGYHPGYQYHHLALSTETCCRPTCATLHCPHGYHERASELSATTVSTETCCKMMPTCGTSFSCPSGFVEYHSHFRAFTLNTDECCRPTCATFQCAHGYLERQSEYLATTVDMETCCKKEPACGTSFSCPSGYMLYHSHFRALHLNVEECCRPTCATFHCAHGYLERQSEYSATTVDMETCCKKEPACGTSFSCPSGYMLYHSHFRALHLNVEECCRPTCDTFTCPHGSITRGANYDCYAGLENFAAGWSEHKKLWCCANRGKGCSGYTPAVNFETCCHTEQTCATYSCPHGYVRDACRSSSTVVNQHTCCRPTCHTFNCPSGYHAFGHYDCQAGLSNWAAGWSESKKAWCCAHEGLGCGHTCSAMPVINAHTCCHHNAVPHSCKLWGDPHIITFDKSHLVFYSTGDFWIVRSPRLKVQGRFQCTDWTASHDKTDYSSMTSIIVSGSIIQDHKIEVQTAVGHILCDGKVILPGFGSTYCGSAKIDYNSVGELVDDAMAFMPHKVVHLTLPHGIFLQLNRWPNFMNAKIDMPAEHGGQDGVCGNFNGVASDDTGKELHRRYGRGVDSYDLLFSNAIPLHVPTAPPSPTRCSPQRHARAAAICKREAAGGELGWSFAECMGDVCDEEKAGHGMFSWQAAGMKQEFHGQ